jgi:hypothetical protein
MVEGGHEVPDALASPLPNPTLSAGVVLSKVEVDKSMQEGKVALEQLLQFEPDLTLKGALPQESEVRPPLMVEMPISTMGAGGSAGAQESAEEALPEGPSV